MPTTKRDYYEILGISKETTHDKIKRAYRSLAMKHHPDRVGADQKKDAEEKFKEISEAYAVLSDDEKRSIYDQYGHAGFDQRYSTEDIFRGADFSDRKQPGAIERPRSVQPKLRHTGRICGPGNHGRASQGHDDALRKGRSRASHHPRAERCRTRLAQALSAR